LTVQFRDAITGYRPVQIRNFLDKKKALALHKELYASTSFEEHGTYTRRYQAHFQELTTANAAFQEHPNLSVMQRLLNHREVKAWMRDVSSSEVNGTTAVRATHFAPADYQLSHTDMEEGDPRERRRIAFAFHLTKEWNPRYGGDFAWLSPAYHIHPSFNAFTFFAVSQASWHFVVPVAANTPPRLKRLALSGWFTSTNTAEAKRLEAAKSDAFAVATFSTVVDGRTGAVIGHRDAYESIDGLWPQYFD
jgi:Rps23 Pro-64 3,4-dihydroxylase Tpa1-like proline 4-hydroxylase